MNKGNYVIYVLLLCVGLQISSCENKAPEINYSVKYEHKTDFSGIISAINNGSLTLAQALAKVGDDLTAKLDLLAAIIKDQTVTTAQKLEAINLAIKMNTDALNDQTEAVKAQAALFRAAFDAGILTLKEAIDLCGSNLSAKLGAIEAVIESQTVSQAEKMDALKSALDAVNQQIKAQGEANQKSMEALGTVIESAINNHAADLKTILNKINTTIDEKATALAAAITIGNETIVAELKAMLIQDDSLMKALTKAVTDGNASIASSIRILDGHVTAQLTLIKEAIKSTNANIVEAINGVKSIIASTSATNAQKLDALKAAIEGVTEKIATESAANRENTNDALDALGGVIEDAIETETTTLWGILYSINSTIGEKATAIASVIQTGDANLVSKLADLISQDNTLMTALTTAVSNGSTNIKDAVGALSSNVTAQTTFLITALNTNSGKIVDALEAVETVISNASATQADKLDVINAAIRAVTTQLGTNATTNKQALEALGTVIVTAVNNQTTDLKSILESLDDNVSYQTTALVAALNGPNNSIVSKLGELLTSNKRLLEGLTQAVDDGLVSVTKAIQAFEANDGMWRENNGKDLYMKPAIWAAISDDGTMTAALIEQMTVTDMTPTYTSNQNDLGHGCPYTFTRIDKKGKVLIPTWDNQHVIVNNDKQETVRIICIYEKQKWEIKSTGCSLYWWEYTITDAERTNKVYGVPTDNRGKMAMEINLSVIVFVYSDEGGVKKLNLSPHFDITMSRTNPSSYSSADTTPW